MVSTGQDTTAQQEGAESLEYYLFNAHGDVVGLTDQNGNMRKQYDYDAWGNEKNPDPNDTNVWRYAGEMYEKETGTYYLRARAYNPMIGRFTSEDVARDGLNWYTYCANNPLNFIDPSGCAEYQIGGIDKAPAFYHDKGYPYNPNAKATWGDRLSYAKWAAMAELSEYAPHLQDASYMYNHYRNGSGKDVKVNYTRAYMFDKTIKSYIDNEVSLIKIFAQENYAQTGETSFEIIGGLQPIPNGTNENWQKTIGAHNTYGHAVVTINPETGKASMKVTFHMEDMYNFNPGQADIASGTPDAVNGRFAEIGWAKEFKTYGSMTKKYKWDLS